MLQYSENNRKDLVDYRRAGRGLYLPLRYILWLLLFYGAMACINADSPGYGQDINREYKLKAVYLYKFATYIEWPKETFQQADSPFVIGILGPDPMSGDLNAIAKAKNINGRKIDIRHYKSAEEVRDCQILFMSRAQQNESQRDAIKTLTGRNILFVGEVSDFLAYGGCINFVVQDNRIRVYISQSAYEREKLKISAHLLRIATVVK